MTELSRECVESPPISSWGCYGLSTGVFAGRGILCWHEELLILLFLTQWCKPQDKNIPWFCKIMIVSIGTVALSENKLNAHFSGSYYRNLHLHKAFPWKFLSVVLTCPPAC